VKGEKIDAAGERFSALSVGAQPMRVCMRQRRVKDVRMSRHGGMGPWSCAAYAKVLTPGHCEAMPFA
jgi:hypothetical protein